MSELVHLLAARVVLPYIEATWVCWGQLLVWTSINTSLFDIARSKGYR